LKTAPPVLVGAAVVTSPCVNVNFLPAISAQASLGYLIVLHLNSPVWPFRSQSFAHSCYSCYLVVIRCGTLVIGAEEGISPTIWAARQKTSGVFVWLIAGSNAVRGGHRKAPCLACGGWLRMRRSVRKRGSIRESAYRGACRPSRKWRGAEALL